MLEDAMWRPNEPVEENVLDLPGIDSQSDRRRSRCRAWRDGLADQTVVRNLEDVRPTERSSGLSSAVSILEVIELALVHRLASLLWRLRRASAIETGLFEIQGEFLLARPQDPAHIAGQPGSLPTRTLANGHKTVWLERTRRSAGQRSRTAVDDVQASAARATVEVPRHRQCFLRLSRLDPILLDRAGAYETRL